MKYYILLLVSMMGSAYCNGQNAGTIIQNQPTWLSEGPQITFPSQVIPGANPTEMEGNAETYLKLNINDLKNQNTDIKLTQNIASPYARYFTYSETFMGTEIYDASIKIGVDKKNNRIVSVLAKTGNVDNWPANTTIQDPDTAQIKKAVGSYDRIEVKKIWFYTENAGVPAFQVNCQKMDGTRDEEMILDAQYNVIYHHSAIQNYRYPDSLVTMYVFYPDPLTSAHSAFVPPYSVNALWLNDTLLDNLAVDSQMVPKQVRVSVLNNDSFILENQYMIERDLGPPYYLENTYSKSPLFHFHRDTSAFRDLMIYYHINNWRSHLSDLGYDSLGSNQITLDPSGGTDDNSAFYAPTNSTEGIIYFGMGGVPDAEDADVPTHEYTHYLSYSACNNCAKNGLERIALDEGTADYFAASNSKAIDTFGWKKLYNWDGNNPADGWSGRTCVSQHIYPGALDTFQFEKYSCGELWSSSLMQIWDTIGRTKTDRIMLETLYSMAGDITMTDAAKLFLKSDSLLYNNADRHIITYYFVQRGFLPESLFVNESPTNPVFYKINSNYFSSANKIYMDFGLPQSGTLTLYDMAGKEISTELVSNSEHVQFNAPSIADGIYILGVNTQGLQKSFKLLK